MLLAIAALLIQFPVSAPHKIQASTTIAESARVAKASAPSAASSAAEVSAPSGQKSPAVVVLSADASLTPVAFAPGRLVAEPVLPVNPALAAPVASPAPVAFQPVPIVAVYPAPVKVDHRREREWLALSIAQHSAAGFDAWSTRRVLTSVDGAREMNPFLRPFAGNASMYAAVQVTPTIIDFVSHRMMNSSHSWMRHTWWVPQIVGAVVSVSSGVHNLGVYNSR
jgi:hypothetical protein